MKKAILSSLILLFFSFSVTSAYAEDCMHDPIYERNWNAVVTTGVRVRSIPCMETSTVLTTVPVGKILKVIAETDGYYKVKLSDGTEGWIGQWLVAKTDQSFAEDVPEAPKEPLYDVKNHTFETAIRYLKNKNIVGGYPDGSFQPNKTVNRAEFTKIIVGAALDYSPEHDPSGYDIYSLSGLSFSDVKTGEWYVPYLRKAVENKIIGGYPDGTFKPSQTINLAEATKILVSALKLTKGEVENGAWYAPYMQSMQNNMYIPNNFKQPDQSVTRGDMAEMTWRIMEKINNKTSTNFVLSSPVETGFIPSHDDNENNNTEICTTDDVLSKINMDQVRTAWLKWYNDARAAEGKHAFKYNEYLNWSAKKWSQYSSDKGVMSHKRPGQTEYYDYKIITQWFADLGITFKNINRITYSENIGRGTFRCSDSDCTQELIDTIRSTFDYYMAEKTKDYRPHYNSIMNPFNEIGLGIVIDEKSGQYYLTVHYGTELLTHPEGVCD